ncbi:MAG TPA: site-2 protease family protein [Usitatibacteraceae bacterium]|jgi:Zn-dependent protease|nr:site-2 protease family protein [Usitatibacteraceae bacterium]
MDWQDIVLYVAINAIPLVLAITLHEAAHGAAAMHFGDRTAWMLGRVSLNPARHIDPVGTLLIPLVLLVISKGGFLFGWAKPVPVNFENLRNPKRDMLWVAAAGPGANVAMLLGWILVAKLLLVSGAGGLAVEFWIRVADAGIIWNLSLAILNLLPLLPLDGGRILASLLPNRLAYAYSRTEPYGMFILLVLVATPVLGWILGPVFAAGRRAAYSLLGLQG